jgi:hypothetical protein
MLICKTLYMIHNIVKNLASHLLVYCCDFILNLWAISVCPFFQVSSEEEIGNCHVMNVQAMVYLIHENSFCC